jgi:hypothetical protein
LLQSKATVAAISIFSSKPRLYCACLFLVSGTCKKEDAAGRGQLLELILDVCKTAEADKTLMHSCLYSISSDGDAQMRNAMANITLKRPLHPTSPIHNYVKSLLLFNLLVGDNDLTGDIDPKHIFKRFRNTLLRKKGVTIAGTFITPKLIKLHLTKAKILSASSANALLNPTDKQDVVLMVRLLNCYNQMIWLFQNLSHDYFT